MNHPQEQEIMAALANMMAVMGVKIDPTKQIPIAQIVGTSSNGIPGLAHDKCGCAGIHGMLPTPAGDWFCDRCEGCVLAHAAGPKLQEGRDGFAKMVEMLKPQVRGHAPTPAEQQAEKVSTITHLVSEGRLVAQVPNCTIGGFQDFNAIEALLTEGSVVMVGGSGKRRTRCLKKKCRHHGHFTYITPVGLLTYSKALYAAYPTSYNLPEVEFFRALTKAVNEIDMLPEAK